MYRFAIAFGLAVSSLLPSPAVGVAQPAIVCRSARFPILLGPVPFAFWHFGVGHPATHLASIPSVDMVQPIELPLAIAFRFLCTNCSGVPAKLLASAVGHPKQSLSDMGRARARSAQICRPASVVQVFQVSEYSIEPSTSSLACNLLAKDRCRLALANETGELRPEVSLVVDAFSFSGTAERLARTTACPNRPVGGPVSEPQGKGPPSDACEEMALSISVEVSRSNFKDAPVVYVSWWY